MAAELSPAGCELARVPWHWGSCSQAVASASTLWHLLLDSGLLVEGMGCKASAGTVESGRCGGLTMGALPAMKAQLHAAPK